MLTANADGDIFYKGTEINNINVPAEYDLVLNRAHQIPVGQTVFTFTGFPTGHSWRVGSVGFAKSRDNLVAFNFTVTLADTNSVSFNLDNTFRNDGLSKGVWAITTGHANVDVDTRTDFIVGSDRVNDPTNLTIVTGNALALSGTDNGAATLTIPTGTGGTGNIPNIVNIHGDYDLPYTEGATFNVYFTVSHTTVNLDVQIAGTIVHPAADYAQGPHVVPIEISTTEFNTLSNNTGALTTEPTIGNAAIGRLFVPQTSGVTFGDGAGQVAIWAEGNNTDLIPRTKTDSPTPVALVLRGDHLFNTDTIQNGINTGTQSTFTFLNSESIRTLENGSIDNQNFLATPGGIYRFNRLTRTGTGTVPGDPFRYSLDTDAYFTATIDTFPNRSVDTMGRAITEIDFTPIFISPSLVTIGEQDAGRDLVEPRFCDF